ncbi:MAG: PD40 domain-containing protein, partial [Anaerolineae bacterium]|nr:PD40 domain-containing protein [Anaerolineae bacterium]
MVHKRGFLVFLIVALAACTASPEPPTPGASSAETPAISATAGAEIVPPSESQEGIYLGEASPASDPLRFRPASVSTDAVELSLVVHPDLRELYFTRLESGKATIFVSRQAAAGWTTPEPASFSGDDDDVSPFVGLDGRTLYFASTRPLPGDTAPAERPPYHIWFVTRVGDGWSDPLPLDLPLASMDGETSPTLTREGTLYYVAHYPDLGGAGLYRSRYVDGAYQLPEKLDILTNTDQIVEVEPFVAPDERFMLFYSAGRSDNLTPPQSGAGKLGDIYVSFQDAAGHWSAPQNVGASVNSTAEESTPTLSPDGEYLFFASNRGAAGRFPDIYWVDAAFLETLDPQANGRAALRFDDLMTGFDFTGPVDEAALTPPALTTASAPHGDGSQPFAGRLELLGEQEGGHIEMVRGQLEPEHAYLPEFDFEFVQSDGYLIPVQRGQIIADHPLWNLILEPGRVWQEPGDGGFSRASLPFALITKGGNAAFNGTLTFLFDEQRVSKVWYQVTQEITTYTRANLWGLLDAVYHPGPVTGVEQLRADFAAELAARLPTRPIAALAEA